MRYGVVVCSACRKARVFEHGRKTTTCGHCSRTLRLRDLTVRHRTDDLHEAQMAVGALNAGRAQRLDEFKRAFDVAEGTATPGESEDPAEARLMAAAARAVDVPGGEGPRADVLARALSEDGEFSEEEFAEALVRVGIPRGRTWDHVKRMLAAGTVFEPRPGRYRAV